jgi:hypothetical protein
MEALRDSCNYFFYVLGDKMDINYIDNVAKSLGLGVKTGMELAEKTGIRANPENKLALHNGNTDLGRWYAADQVMASIGQSINSFTPIQLCAYTATLANQGVRYQATFLNRVLDADYNNVVLSSQPVIASRLDISDEAYEAYSQGMRMVITEGSVRNYFKDYPIAVTAKIRTGIDEDHKTYLEAGKIAQEEGADGVILHARSCAQYYGGHSNWEEIKRLKEELSIPVIGNGDIFSGQDAVEMMKETGWQIAKCRSEGGRLQLQRKKAGNGSVFAGENWNPPYVCLWWTVAGVSWKMEEKCALVW